MNLCFLRNDRAGSEPVYGSMTDCKNSKNPTGTLYHLECFVLVSVQLESGGTNRYAKIKFRNPSGSWVTGWIRFNGSGIRYWEDYAEAYVNGNPRYIVRETTNIYTGNKVKIATLTPKDYVYTRPGSAQVGATQEDWLQCFAYKKDGVYKEPGGTMFVDTQIKHGSTKPHVRGSW